MRIDLSCPLETLRFELSRDDNLKVRAYLTLNNLSASTVLHIEGDVLWEDAHGQTETQPIAFDALEAPGKSRFRMQVSTDQLPGANRVQLMMSAVEFEDGSVWRADEAQAVCDIEPPLPPPGSELNKLIALAGLDASNYPIKTGSYWICVCGRPNPADGAACVRCDRDRDETMARFGRKAVLEADLPKGKAEKIEVEIPNFLYDRQSPEQDARERLQAELQMLEARYRSQRSILVRRSVFLVVAVLLVLSLAYAFDWLSQKQQFSQGFRQPAKIEGTPKPTLMPTPDPTEIPTEAPPARPQNPIPAQPHIERPV